MSIRATAGTRPTARGAGAVIMPARTVAIWIADVAPIAATSCPPNAGFHATSRPLADFEVDRVAGEARAQARGDA